MGGCYDEARLVSLNKPYLVNGCMIRNKDNIGASARISDASMGVWDRNNHLSVTLMTLFNDF